MTEQKIFFGEKEPTGKPVISLKIYVENDGKHEIQLEVQEETSENQLVNALVYLAKNCPDIGLVLIKDCFDNLYQKPSEMRKNVIKMVCTGGE